MGMSIFIFPGGPQIALHCVIHKFIFQQESGSWATAYGPRSTFHNRYWSHHAKPFIWRCFVGDHPCLTADDAFSKPLSLAKSTWAQHSWTALSTHISFFSRSLCLFFFTLIPVWLSHATCRSKARGNGNPSWRWGYNLRYVGGGGWSPPSFTEVIHFQRQYCTHKSLMEMQWCQPQG